MIKLEAQAVGLYFSVSLRVCGKHYFDQHRFETVQTAVSQRGRRGSVKREYGPTIPLR